LCDFIAESISSFALALDEPDKLSLDCWSILLKELVEDKWVLNSFLFNRERFDA
jgi:hypothetical protein